MKKSLKILIIIITAFVFISLFASCSRTIERTIKQDMVNDFYDRAENAVNKYGEEPVPGSLAPFPSSLSIAGKALLINVPVDYGFDPRLPSDLYEELDLAQYSWYTADPDEVIYIILIDRYYSPSDELGNGNTIIFTIVDLGYNEKIYRSFLSGEKEPPYRELAEILEHLTLK